MVLKKASETQLCLDGNLLKVSTIFEPRHDRSILLAKNLNPRTSKKTFQKFVEMTIPVDVFNIVYGKDNTAIVILKSEIGKFRIVCTSHDIYRLSYMRGEAISDLSLKRQYHKCHECAQRTRKFIISA